MVEQGGTNPGGTGDAAGLPNTAPSARDRQKLRAAQVSQDEEGGRASGGRDVSANVCAQLGTHPWPTRNSALRQRSVLDGEKIQSPKFVYDVKALRDNARIIVQRGALLRKADFRSPSSKLKLLGRPGSDHPIAACRRAELQAGGRAMLTGGLGTRAPTSTASEVTMAELSAPAGLVDAHAMRKSWLLKGQNSLDNTGHHNCSLIFCFICIRLLGLLVTKGGEGYCSLALRA
ncbi:BQ5605_C012g06746 [Microbotryum silenes-dioicae]|uniref:BQ5605_C012g06746 protein n=1 Tax=Microbotryum silenes-dioicae TaxID=796604 RepID=A0A2X0NPE4_9BASI|nr:BQ5605_C012g06746 [Microbotryum silenes-dioicae]